MAPPPLLHELLGVAADEHLGFLDAIAVRWRIGSMSLNGDGTGVPRNPLLGTDWGALLKDELVEQWPKLQSHIEKERLQGPVYPPANEIFRAFELTSCERTKVVILGQDPYHGAGQAHGLCFSVPCGTPKPPSLEISTRNCTPTSAYPSRTMEASSRGHTGGYCS
jgi:hypothetical protein